MVGSMRSMIGFTPLSIFSIFANQSSLEVFGVWNAFFLKFLSCRLFLAPLFWSTDGLSRSCLSCLVQLVEPPGSNSTWEVPQFNGRVTHCNVNNEQPFFNWVQLGPILWPRSKQIIGSKFKPFNPRSSGVYPDHLPPFFPICHPRLAMVTMEDRFQDAS